MVDPMDDQMLCDDCRDHMTDDEALQLEIERRALIHTASEIGYFCHPEMYNDLMAKAKDIKNRLKADGRLDEEARVRTLAHQYWLLEGKPNGEEYRYTYPYGKMKIKDIHWLRAKETLKGFVI